MLRRAIFLSAAFALLGPVQARADPISIVSGFLTYSRGDLATFNWVGAEGSLAGTFGLTASESYTPAHACVGCPPGGALDPSVVEFVPFPGGPDLVAELTLAGTSVLLDTLAFRIDADDIVIPAGGEGASTVANFVMRGVALGITPELATQAELFGQGQVRVFFSGGDWVSSEFLFQPSADPVPEPATLLLIGTGMIGLAAGFRKRKRDDRN
jgi:hypothetical protein